MTDDPLTICPECGALIRRVLYPAGVVFKGSGFYKTDHGNSMLANKNDEAAKVDGKSTTSDAASSNGTKSASETTGSSSPSSESKASSGTVEKVA